MKHLQLHVKIMILVGVFICLLVAMSWLAISSVNTISSQIRLMSEQNVGLIKAKNQTQHQLLTLVIESEQGLQHASKAVQADGYGTLPIETSKQAFIEKSDAVRSAIKDVESILQTMDDGASVVALRNLIPEIQQQLNAYLESSLVTYDWWIKLKLFQSKKTQKVADAAREEVNRLMQEISATVDQISASQLEIVEGQRVQLQQFLIGMLVVALAGGGLIAWLIIRGIAGPLANVVEVTNQLAEGNLNVETSTDERRDEVGQLQSSIQLLARQLRDVIGGVTESANQMATAAEELSQITTSSESLISRQQIETDQIANAIREINETAHHMSEHTCEATNIAGKATDTTTDGNQQLVKTAEVVDELAAGIEDSSGVMVELDGHTQEITTVLSVIVGIAEQTNLLALNAAIEAARAGEQGRGFAVVADEVRGLAQRTQESVQEIEQTITRLQQGTRKAVSVINKSHGHSQEVVDQTNQSVNALKAIEHTVAKLTEINVELSTSATEQSAVTTSVAGNIDTITDIATESSASVKQISHSSSELARVADQMRQAISYFNLTGSSTS